MITIVTIGIDLAKNVFAVHGVDATSRPAGSGKKPTELAPGNPTGQ